MIQSSLLAVAAFCLFIHLILGASMMPKNTVYWVYLPLVATIGFDAGVFVCAVSGNLSEAKDFATMAFVSGGIYALMLYIHGVHIHKCLDEKSEKVS